MTLAAQVLSLGALVIFEHSRGRRLATQLAAFGGRPHGADADAVVGAVTVFAVLMMLVAGTTMAAAAAYVSWLVRARQVNDRSAPAGPVAAAWLIPGVNLIAPLLLVDEVWRGTAPPHDRRRWLTLLTAWWLTWLATLALVTTRLPLGSSDGLTGIGLPELACATVSALLCAATVRDITRIQCSTSRARLRGRARLRTAGTVTQLPTPPTEPAPLEQAG
ncbi:DUF4328 domain-containing protein [Nonomuraea sp. NPDC026600]|uniref:DUF4328 domain-containing protein n=1 Tax=Nonomuraea sp. NPDC026600 TaxID=3155363 RepID=UPI0034118A4E